MIDFLNDESELIATSYFYFHRLNIYTVLLIG